MDPTTLALGSAALVGTADFLGGFAGRKGRLHAVVVWSHLIGLATIAVISYLIGGSPTTEELLWGAAAGVCGSIAITILYRGFTVSQIGIVSPISSVGAAAIPVLIGLFTGERPTNTALVGVMVGIVAIALVSRSAPGGGGGSTLVGVLHGLGAGLGFAGMFVLLSFTSEQAGTWPLVPGRLAGAIAVTLWAMALKSPLRPVKGSWLPTIGAGVFAMVGNGLFILAVQRGLLSLVSVLTSLYPAASVLWARVVLKERLRPVQLVGFVLALVAVALIITS